MADRSNKDAEESNDVWNSQRAYDTLWRESRSLWGSRTLSADERELVEAALERRGLPPSKLSTQVSVRRLGVTRRSVRAAPGGGGWRAVQGMPSRP